MLPCYWGMQLQFARCLITVGARWRWVAIGAAVLLGNATADCWTHWQESSEVAERKDLNRKVKFQTEK